VAKPGHRVVVRAGPIEGMVAAIAEVREAPASDATIEPAPEAATG
jgi:hypothetical protein